MKLKKLLILVLAFVATLTSAFLTGCKGTYDDVWVSITSSEDISNGLNLNYVYEEDTNSYTCEGSNEVLVKVNELKKKMPTSISKNAFRTKAICFYSFINFYTI